MKISKLNKDRSKKLDLSSFFDGEECYVTICKLPREKKRELQRYVVDTTTTKIGLMIAEKIENKEFNKDDILDTGKILKLMAEMPEADKDKINSSTKEYEKILLDYGLDAEKHNFVDDNDKKISLNYNLIVNEIGLSEDIVEFILKAITGYNGKGAGLGELKDSSSIM